MHKHSYGYETYEGYDRLVCVAPDCDMRWPLHTDLNHMEDVLEAAVEYFRHLDNDVVSDLGASLEKLYDAVMATGRVDEEQDLGESKQP